MITKIIEHIKIKIKRRHGASIVDLNNIRYLNIMKDLKDIKKEIYLLHIKMEKIKHND